jgi:hypothetical protein
MNMIVVMNRVSDFHLHVTLVANPTMRFCGSQVMKAQL